jgi:hypothetical protein
MVILVMFVLVGAIAAGFAMLSSERAADDASIQSQAAVALAETGLQQGLRNRPGLGLPRVPPAGIESTRVSLTGGYADVVTTLLRPAQDTTVPALYYVRSRGVRTVSGFPGAGNGVAMASAFATYLIQTIKIDAAMTGINGIRKAGTSGILSGYDQCNLSAPPRAAVAVPTSPGYDGQFGPLQGVGTPPIAYIGSTAQQAATGIPFDWADIVSGSAITIQLLEENYPPNFDDLFNKGEVTPTSKVSFNPAFFADYAKVAGKGNAVTIEFKGEKAPFTIGLKGEKVEWRALLMPMRII